MRKTMLVAACAALAGCGGTTFSDCWTYRWTLTPLQVRLPDGWKNGHSPMPNRVVILKNYSARATVLVSANRDACTEVSARANAEKSAQTKRVWFHYTDITVRESSDGSMSWVNYRGLDGEAGVSLFRRLKARGGCPVMLVIEGTWPNAYAQRMTGDFFAIARSLQIE